MTIVILEKKGRTRIKKVYLLSFNHAKKRALFYFFLILVNRGNDHFRISQNIDILRFYESAIYNSRFLDLTNGL